MSEKNATQSGGARRSTPFTPAANGTPARVSRLLSQHEQQIIRDAVASVEGRSSVEILPVIVKRSSVYRAPEWKAAALAGLLSMAAVLLLYVPGLLWADPRFADFLLLPLAGLLGGMLGWGLTNLIAPLERLFIGRREMDEAIANGSFREFMLQGLSGTRDRTGVLIYISLFERRVQILADRGIHEKVKPGYWDEQVERIVTAIREGNMARGLAEVIENLGQAMQEQFPRRDDDINELPDLVIRD